MIGIPNHARGNLHPVITGTFEIVQQVVSGGSWPKQRRKQKHIPGKLMAGSPKNHLVEKEHNLNQTCILGFNMLIFQGKSFGNKGFKKRRKQTLHFGASWDHVHVWHAFYLAIRMRHMMLLFLLVDRKATFLVIFPLRTKWFGITTGSRKRHVAYKIHEGHCPLGGSRFWNLVPNWGSWKVGSGQSAHLSGNHWSSGSIIPIYKYMN